jgi:putative intracellular protease/amidase/YHS domain-containing protein
MRSFPHRFSIPLAGTCLALACVWFGSDGIWPDARAGRPDVPPDKPVAVKGLDPVLLTEGKEVKGQAELSVTREGFRYLFADAANKGKFEKDPARYEIQFHGHCAMMPEAAAQPDLFTVYKGRIYAFGSEGCQAAFREEPEKYVQQQPPKPAHSRRSVVILIFSGMELLDFAGPAEVFASAGFKVSTVALNRNPIRCMGLVSLTPDHTLADCPRADILVIPGGSTAVSRNKSVTDWVAERATEAEVTMSVCTGAFVLAKAGVLDGKAATTHWSGISALRKQFPKITVLDEQRVVDNGNIVTTAGVSAGIDGALHVVDRLLGRPAATKTARYMEYIWQPTAEKKS